LTARSDHPPALLARAQLRLRRGELVPADRDVGRVLELEPGEEALGLRAEIGLRRYLRRRGMPVPVERGGSLFAIDHRAEDVEAARLRTRVEQDGAALRDGYPLAQAVMKLFDRDVAGALQALTAVVDSQPHRAEGWLYRGHARLLAIDVPGALEDFERARRLRPIDHDALLGLAAASLLRGTYGRVKTHCDAADALEPSSESVRLRARALAIEGRYEAAEGRLKTAIGQWPEDPSLHGDLGYLLFSGDIGRGREDRRAEARAELDRAIELNPQAWFSLLQRGRLLADSGEPEAAVADFGAVLAIRPYEPLARRWRAEERLKLKQWRGAGLDYAKFMTAPSRYLEGKSWNLEQTHVRLALDALGPKVAASPEDGSLLLAYGVFQRFGPEPEGAIAPLRAAAAREELGPAAEVQLGMLYRDLKRVGDAIAAFKRALAYPVARSRAAFGIGQLYWYDADDGMAAAEWYELALRTDPLQSMALNNLANVAMFNRRADIAIPLFARCSYFYADSIAHRYLAAMHCVGRIDDGAWAGVRDAVGKPHTLDRALANKLLEFGRVEEAVQVVERNTSPHGAATKMLVLAHAGRHADALAVCDRMLRDTIPGPAARHDLLKLAGLIRLASDDGPQEAKKAFEGARDAFPGGKIPHKCVVPDMIKLCDIIEARMAGDRSRAVNLALHRGALDRVGASTTLLRIAGAIRRQGPAGSKARQAWALAEAGLLLRLRRPADALRLLEAEGVASPESFQTTDSDVIDVWLTAIVGAGQWERAAQLIRKLIVRAVPLGAQSIAMAARSGVHERDPERVVQMLLEWQRGASIMPVNEFIGRHFDVRELQRDAAALLDDPTVDAGAVRRARSLLHLRRGDSTAALAGLEAEMQDLEALVARLKREGGSATDVADARENLALTWVYVAEARGGVLLPAHGAWRVGSTPPDVRALEIAPVIEALERALSFGWRSPSRLKDSWNLARLAPHPKMAAFRKKVGIK
jgi:tetratricopeptide (TPR) repeat protein